MPSHTPRLQTNFEKYRAAPTPFRKSRNIGPSPLVACPTIGIAFHGRNRRTEASPHPFRFHPKLHRLYEHQFSSVEYPKRMKILRDMDTLNSLLPIDTLLQSLQDQADAVERELDQLLDPDLDPIQKMSPEFRRLKSLKSRKGQEKVVRFRKMKKPERGKLIAPVRKPAMKIENILAMATAKATEAQPKIVAMMLISRLLELELEQNTTIGELIATRRSLLYQEEGATWLKLFIPGASDDDPKIPSVFKMFDNNDEGIPREILAKRERTPALTTYQFRVLAKRFAICGGVNFDERVLLGELLGLNEEQVHCFFLRLNLEKEMEGKTEQQIRTLVYNTYKAAVNATQTDGEDFRALVRTYDQVMVPILDEMFDD